MNSKRGSEELRLLDIPADITGRLTSADLITDLLREAILSGHLGEGQELNQVKLSEFYNVNRIIIREAIRQLQGEGLVEGRPRRRAVVATMNTESVSELIDICTLIEIYLLERALPNITSEWLVGLQQICDEMDSIHDTSEWIKKNQEFHLTMYEPSGAAYAAEVLVQLWTRVSRHFLVSTGHAPEKLPEQNEEHRRILEAVEQGDIDTVVRELRFHNRRSRDYVISGHP